MAEMEFSARLRCKNLEGGEDGGRGRGLHRKIPGGFPAECLPKGS